MTAQLPPDIAKKAVKGLSYLAHPLRLRILEAMDIFGALSVSAIAKAVREEQVIVSQSLKKLREADLVKAKRRHSRGISGQYFHLHSQTLWLYDRQFLFFGR